MDFSGIGSWDEERKGKLPIHIGDSSNPGHKWESQFYDNNSEEQQRAAPKIEREHMFDKVVTPSDVGKLNRLVIPKQYAEKYFPLDSTTNEKDLQLNFEDRNGKSWRFRYSYWNSSQSYVMTKGWSRFVKEKKLDAGDIVSFQRGVGDLSKECLYIDWRRRPDVPDPSSLLPQHLFHRAPVAWSPLLLQPPGPSHNHFHVNPYMTGYSVNLGCASYAYNNMRSAASPQQFGMAQMQQYQGGVFDSVPVVHGKAAGKRLRLFGVNMDCPETESNEVQSSTTIQQLPHHLQLRLYNGTPGVPSKANSSSSSMSLNLDI